MMAENFAKTPFSAVALDGAADSCGRSDDPDARSWIERSINLAAGRDSGGNIGYGVIGSRTNVVRYGSGKGRFRLRRSTGAALDVP